MPSSLPELTSQLGVNCEPPEQVAASGGIGARSIILTFPGLPSCCMEITINFEDDNGSDSKGTQSEEVDIRLPTHDFSTTTREELDQPYEFRTCEDGLAHEFDQSTVYIGLDSELTAGRKKARKKTESLVRTLPILAHCSKRWLNFRSRKGHERGRICAFESGDVGKITSSSTSVDDGNDSPRQKLDTKQGFVSSRTPLTFLNSMTTFSKSSSHDRKKSLERSHDPRAVKYSSRKSKSGVGISETKPEALHGEEVDAGSPKQKSDPSMNQLTVNNLSQLTRSKHNPQVEFDLSDSHEKVKKHGGSRYSETNKDRCKVVKGKDTVLMPEGGPQLLSKPSCLSKSMPSQSSSKQDCKTASHKALDTMFVDVIKMLVAQEDHQNAKRSPSLAEQQEKHTLQADPWEIGTHQQMNEYRAFGNNKSRTSDHGSMVEDRKPQEHVLGGSISRNGLPRCEVSGLNFPLRSNSYVRNIDCGRNVHCDRNISCDHIERSKRNISCDRNMGCDKNEDCISNIRCERSRSFDRNIPCDMYISSDGYSSCDRKTSCAGNINCDKHISCSRKIICDGNISCERKFRSQHQTTKGNSNNCHLCCWGEVSECKDFIAVFVSASSSDDSLRGSFGSNEDLISSEDRKLRPRDEESRTSKVWEMGSSLQGRLQNAADDKQAGGTSRNSDQYGEKLAVPVLSGPSDADHSSSQENLCGLQLREQSRGASIWKDPKDNLSNSVATKAEGNAGSFQNAKYIFKSGNFCTGKDNDDSTCSHISIHRGIATGLYDSNNVDSTNCAHNCSRASSCRQCNQRRRIPKEREDGNESQLCVAEGGSLPKENGSHESDPKYAVVAVKSSKLHKIFSKSSENTRRTEGRPSECDYTSPANENPRDVQLTSGNLDDTMSSTSVNLDSEDEQFRLVEQEKPKENGGSVVLKTAESPNAKAASLLGRFISLEKRKCRLSLTSSFIGKAKTALFCVRSRSSSPAALGTKIKNMFFRESVDRILSKNPTAILETEKDKSQVSGSNQENSSRQDLGSKQGVVLKDRADLKLVVRSKKKETVTVVPKELGSPYCSTDLDGSIVKEYYTPLIETTQPSGQDSLEQDEEDNVKHIILRSEASTSRSNETKPERSPSTADSTSIKIHNGTLSATARSESASFDYPATSDIDLSVDLRRKIRQYLGGQFKAAPQILPITAPVTVIIPPSLEVIAEAESPSEDSTVDEEMAPIKCERFIGRDNLTKVVISTGPTLEYDNGLCAVSTSSSVSNNQTCGRKLRMSSSYEDCTREFGVVSLGNNILKPTPLRTHSWLSTFEAAQTELQAINAMAIISRKVKIKRYPSFPNLTDINDEDVCVSPVNTSGSNDCIVSEDTCGENSLLVQKNDELRLTDSLNLGSFLTAKTQAECITVNNSGRTIQKAVQSEFSPDLVVQGKKNTDLYADNHNFKLPNAGTKISTLCTQSWTDSEHCEDVLSCSSCLTTSPKVNDATAKISADLLTIVPSSLSYTDHAQPAYFTHLQTPFLFVANNLSFAESVNTSTAEEGDIASVSREITTPGSFMKPDGVMNESSGSAEVAQESTSCRDEEVVDTCNSCLSDVETEDTSAGNDKCSLDEKTSTNDLASSIIKTANKRKKAKTNNNKYALTATHSKTKAVRSETVLAETANTKTRKRSGFSSITDFTKRDSRGRKERSKNMNNTASGLFEVRDDSIDVDITSFRSSGGSKLFVVTSASSIFGAPDKRAASGLKSIKSPTKRSLVTNQILKLEPEETDDEDSDTLTNTGLDQTQDSNIDEGNKVDSKSFWDAFENETPKIDSQTQTGQMFDTIRMNETDANAQSLLNSLMHSASSCVNRGHSSLDITLCRDYALGEAPQMNLGNSSHQNLGRPKLPLIKTTSCFNCACHKTSSAFPAQDFLSRTMPKKLAHRTTWSSRTGPTKEDFTSRARNHLQRCDEVLQRSTGVINRSQEMSFRANRQIEHSSETETTEMG